MSTDPKKVWSLGEMLELKAGVFLEAITQMRTLIVHLDRIDRPTELVGTIDLEMMAKHLDQLLPELEKAGARSALISALRLRRAVEPDSSVTYDQMQRMMRDIESRFADHLNDIKLYVLNQNEAYFMEPVDRLLSVNGRIVEGFSLAYPNAAFEIEEAAKCFALDRFTASAFHSMRAAECGIRALCRYLGIPDATKPAEKNWAVILGRIKDKIGERWPAGKRINGSVGAKMESLYATLDAIKNPWRNATMHVETIYAPHEAIHIARCVGMFLLDLSKYCDEEGRQPEESPAMVASEAGSEPASPF